MIAPVSVIPPRHSAGFTLVELLVATSVLLLLVMVLISMVDQTSRIWRFTTAKGEQFRQARTAFETMTSRVSQATLGTYWDYDNKEAPTRYERRSELRFISGPSSELIPDQPDKPRPTHSVFFIAPLGVTEKPEYRGFENLLCTWGYYLEYADDQALRPGFLDNTGVPRRYRSRLMELWQPSEKNGIYEHTSPAPGAPAEEINRARKYRGREWYLNPLSSSPAPVHSVAENVIALVITPRLAPEDEAEVRKTKSSGATDLSPLAPKYLYDSAPPSTGVNDARYSDPRLNPIHQLPPVLQITMVSIDEESATRLQLGANSGDIFALQDKFKETADFSKDISVRSEPNASLEALLIARRINYRIFSTNVIIRGAKWSREQVQ